MAIKFDPILGKLRQAEAGAKGDTGATGADGVGVPTAGTTGQVLNKASNTNFDTAWHTPAKADVGLGSVVNADTTTTTNITDATDKRFVTDAQRTVITNTSGMNTGDQDVSGLETKASLAADVRGTLLTGLSLATNQAIAATDSILLAFGYLQKQITDALASIATKVTANGAITGATKTKVTYDTKGLVTSGADATTADIAASTNKNYVTDAQATVIGNTSGTNTGDQTAIANATLANMATKTYKGRTSALTGAPEDVAVATVKTDLALVKADVGLGSVDNTTDAGKPVSTAQQTALDLKLNLAGGTMSDNIDFAAGKGVTFNNTSHVLPNTPTRTDLGFYSDTGAGFEIYNYIDATRPGEFRVVYGGGATQGQILFIQADGAGGFATRFTLDYQGNLTVGGTVAGSNLSGTNTGDQTLAGLGGVATSRTITINGVGFDLSANRTWNGTPNVYAVNMTLDANSGIAIVGYVTIQNNTYITVPSTSKLFMMN